MDAAASKAAAPRANPLSDLIATEEVYVRLLSLIVKRIASAWSRHNFPPPHLDAAFRAIENCLRTNRALLAKLNEIGVNPSSPKALGDLLMRWIDDLEPAYTRYTANYRQGFDTYEPVQSNAKLAPILAEHASTEGAPSPLTLDALFLLPFKRVEYYKRLYSKLLRSTQPGRSDHRLLISANDKLDRLLALADAAASRRAGEEDGPVAEEAPRAQIAAASVRRDTGADEAVAPARASAAGPRGRDSVERTTLPDPIELPPLPLSPNIASGAFSGASTPDLRLSMSSAPSLPSAAAPPRTLSVSPKPRTVASFASETSDGALSAHSGPERTGTPPTVGGASPEALELERRLDTARTLDIFTMKPKRCRLQMHPSTLTFMRELRTAGDVTLTFTPASDPERREVVIRRAHVFLLTDLFLVCERVAPGEPIRPGAEMWLLFPPLAGKHLRVALVDNDPCALEVLVMKKERLILRAPTPRDRGAWMDHFDDAIAFGASTSLRVRTGSMGSRSGTPSPAGGSASSPGFAHQSLPAPPSMAAPSPTRAAQHRSFGEERPARAHRPGLEDDFVPPPPRKQSMYGMSPQMAAQATLGFPVRSPPPPGPGFVVASPQQMAQGPYGPPPGPFAPGPYPPGPSNGYGPPNGFSPAPRRPSASRSMPASTSTHSHASAPGLSAPPMPGNLLAPGDRLGNGLQRSRSAEGMRHHYRAPSASIAPDMRSRSELGDEFDDSPPASPVERAASRGGGGPVKSSIVAQMRCKVFLQQSRQNWRSLGVAKLKLYLDSNGVKQLVVEGDKGIVISSHVDADGVERVGKTGVAVETLGADGVRTGQVYMLHLKSEQSAVGLYTQLLAGSDRADASRR